MSSRYMLGIIFSLIFILSMPMMALAQDSGASCMITRFEGQATVNGNPAPDNLRVTAEINGVVMGNSITSDGQYGINGYELDVKDNDNNCENTATIYFYIEGKPAGESYLRNDNDYEHFVVLDLSATGVTWCGDGSCNNGETQSSCSKDCGSPSTSPSSHPSSNPGGGGPTVTTTVQECTPDWECSGWTQCIDGFQNRTCTDLDECDSEDLERIETQQCGLNALLPDTCEDGDTVCVGSSIFQCGTQQDWSDVETCEFGCEAGACVEEPVQEAGNPLTGMFLNPITMYGLAAFVALVIIGGLVWKIKK